ncbi:hypothetical protein ANANG_G00311830 [Anguilla anguilla]|uniref:Sushi domain-containing protein n=1 Tax=Anguilla anguilla TaxID=7936 RepID=A0A9D3LPW2_ANGAN|nr:hypothetical protein ANANG_G00311830 [Anguilla anguilla]
MGPAFMRFCGRYNRIMSGNVTRLFFMLLSLAKIRHYGILCDSESCPAPPHKNHTKPFNQTQAYQEDHKHRYACAEGFVRKAGTSAQIRCSRSGNALKWDDEGRSTALVCIRDPRLKPLEAPQSTPTALEPKSTIATTTMSKTTTKVQHSPPDTTEPNNQGPGQVAQNKTTTVSLGVIAVIFLLIALILVALRQMRNRRGFRLPLAEQRQQIPMGPIEPQDQRYIPRGGRRPPSSSTTTTPHNRTGPGVRKHFKDQGQAAGATASQSVSIHTRKGSTVRLRSEAGPDTTGRFQRTQPLTASGRALTAGCDGRSWDAGPLDAAQNLTGGVPQSRFPPSIATWTLNSPSPIGCCCCPEMDAWRWFLHAAERRLDKLDRRVTRRDRRATGVAGAACRSDRGRKADWPRLSSSRHGRPDLV